MKKLFLIFVSMFTFAFGAIESAYAVDYPFSLTTSSISSGGTFEFMLSAQGTFYVDCGTGGTLSSDDSTANAMISGGTINKTDTTQYTFKCTYSSAGTKTIRFGGTATNYAYDPNSSSPIPSISFYTSAANPALITSISGNISTIFPYISGNAADGAQPRFNSTFRGTNITSIPDTLFSGYTVASKYMFSNTFSGCTGLTSIPANLFFPNATSVSGAYGMFQYTFTGCTGLTSIPANLFFPNATSVSGASYMFSGTFYNCTGLTSIPANLFFPNATSVSGAIRMFMNTFYGCSGLTSIPENLFFPNATSVSGAQSMFTYTFYGCTGLTSIPANLFSKITSGAVEMFNSTFNGCTGLTSIPENLFSKITGGASGMFTGTFNGCTGLTSIPENLFFPNATSVSGAQNMFNSTFSGCTGLRSIPANLFSKITSGASNMFSFTFYNCTGLTSIPANLFSKITSGARSMFYVTFQRCSNLTGYIPPTLFDGLIKNNAATDTFSATFSYTGMLTSCPSGTTQYASTYTSAWGGKVSCQPNAINMTFDGVSAGTCTYGGTFVPPTPAARPGYIFSGWKVKTINP